MSMIDVILREFDLAVRFLLSLTWSELAFFFLPVLVFDIPRVIAAAITAIFDEYVFSRRTPDPKFEARLKSENAPLVSMIVPGLNEGATVGKTVRSLLAQDYPNKEIIVVDDGSTDNMARVCLDLQREHGINFVCLRPRQGKSAAINTGIQMSRGEFVMTVDADGTYDHDAVSQAMRFFAEPRVGAVSGNVRVRNAFACVLTRMQTIEYILSINIARRFMSRMRILLIVSGAFGLFRRSALDQVGGFNVGPGEDREVTVRLHKAGYRVRFSGRAVCMTDAPTSWRVIAKQRLRWNRSPIRCQFRMHADIYKTWFSPLTTLAFMDWTLYSMALLYSRFFFWFVIYVTQPHTLLPILIGAGALYGCANLFQMSVAILLSERKLRDLAVVPFLPFFPFYKLYLALVRGYAYVNEALYENSYHDNFVPPWVRAEAKKIRYQYITNKDDDRPEMSATYRHWLQRGKRSVAIPHGDDAEESPEQPTGPIAPRTSPPRPPRQPATKRARNTPPRPAVQRPPFEPPRRPRPRPAPPATVRRTAPPPPGHRHRRPPPRRPAPSGNASAPAPPRPPRPPARPELDDNFRSQP